MIQPVNAQCAAVDRGPANVAVDGKLFAEQRASVQMLRRGGLQHVPRRVAHLGDLHRGRPAGIIKLGGVPVGLGLDGRFPRAVNQANQRLAALEGDHHLSGQSGRALDRIGNRHGQAIVAGMQMLGDVHQLRGAESRPRRRALPIDEQFHRIVDGDEKVSPANDIVLGNGQQLAKVAGAGRGLFAGVDALLGRPNPHATVESGPL